MTRLIAVLILALLAAYIFGRVKSLGTAGRHDRAANVGAGRSAVVDTLVTCAACGTLVPAARAVGGDRPHRGARYCSPACRTRADETSAPS